MLHWLDGEAKDCAREDRSLISCEKKKGEFEGGWKDLKSDRRMEGAKKPIIT